MKIDQPKTATPSAAPAPAPERAAAPAEAESRFAADGIRLSAGAKAAPKDEKSDNIVDKVANKTHTPHGSLHVVEAVEKGVHQVARLSRPAGQVGRAASTAAAASEAAKHSGHHGVIGKAEHLMEKGLTRAGSLLGRAIAVVPMGSRIVNGLGAAASAPGRFLGPRLDRALAGTRLGGAVQMTGSGGRLVANVGGRIPLFGALLGGVIGVADVKGAIKTLKDPDATTKEKSIAGAQGLLSGVSGVLGLGAVGVAAAAAIGLTAPVSVPLLLGASAIAGAGAFGLYFLKKK